MKSNSESLIAIVLTVVLVVAVGFIAANLAFAMERVTALDIQSDDDMAYTPASKKVWCIMPPAQQRFCRVD